MCLLDFDFSRLFEEFCTRILEFRYNLREFRKSNQRNDFNDVYNEHHHHTIWKVMVTANGVSKNECQQL